MIAIAPAACAIAALCTAAGPAAPARAIALSPSAPAVSPSASPAAWVDNYLGFTIQPVNTRTGTAGTQIKLNICCNYLGLTVAPDGATVYVAQDGGGSDQMYPVNAVTGKVGTAITVGVNPGDIAIAPDGKTAYVPISPNPLPPFDGYLVPVDLATGTAGPRIPVGLAPGALAITPDGQTAYVVNEGSDSVTPVDLATGTPGKPIKVGVYPAAIAITPNGKMAYVANSDYLKANKHDTVTPINLVTNKAEKPIVVGPDPISIVITANGATAYVSTTHNIRPINLATRKVGKPITLGGLPGDLAISPAGGMMYAIETGDKVIPVSLATGRPGKPIKVGKDPAEITFAPGWLAPSESAAKTGLGPALAVFRGVLYEASVSGSGEVGYSVRRSRWSAIKTVHGTWGTARSQDAPALAVYGGRLYAFWTSAATGAIDYSAFTGTSWSAPGTVAGSWGHADSAADPSATTTVTGSALYVAWTTASGSVDYSDFTGSTWAKQASTVTKVSADAPAIAGVADGPNTPPGSSTIAFAWTGKAGAVGYGQLTTSGFKDLGVVPGPVTDAAPALAYAGSARDGTLYLASTAAATGKVGYQAIFHVAGSNLVPGNWTAQEFQPAANTKSGPALAAGGYVVYLGWRQSGTDALTVSSALNPY